MCDVHKGINHICFLETQKPVSNYLLESLRLCATIFLQKVHIEEALEIHERAQLRNNIPPLVSRHDTETYLAR